MPAPRPMTGLPAGCTTSPMGRPAPSTTWYTVTGSCFLGERCFGATVATPGPVDVDMMRRFGETEGLCSPGARPASASARNPQYANLAN